MLEIHPTLLLYQGAIFVLFVFLMYRFAYRPLAKMIEARKAAIASTLNEAEALKSEAEKAKVENEARSRQIEDERKRILDAAVAEGNHRKELIIADSRAEAEQLLERTRAAIDKERRLAVREAKADLGAIALEVVRKFLRRKMDKKTEEVLIASVARDLGEGGGKAGSWRH